MKLKQKFVLFIAIICIPFSIWAQGGIIRGSIVEAGTRDPLIAATIQIEELVIGTISDINGNYVLSGVPVGKFILRISYLGYETRLFDVEISQRGDVKVINAELTPLSLEIDDIVITGQARGQTAAIQQQRNSMGIVNVVSRERLEELPDVNVAEAIGRLPGLMVSRSGGEGQSIIIRGFSPKYNTVAIGGHMAPATGLDDRTTDLTMITPDIIGGVEVRKANTADMDAEGLGGTVNIQLREAAQEFRATGMFQGGYSGHTAALNQYKGNIFVSNRVFDNRLGVMFTANLEQADRSSDVMTASYTVRGDPNYEAGQTFIKPWATGVNLQANSEIRSRYGGSMLLDYKLGSHTRIKASSFAGFLNRDMITRTKYYRIQHGTLEFRQNLEDIEQSLFSGAIEANHTVLGTIIDWGAGMSKTVTEKPYDAEIQSYHRSFFKGYAEARSFDTLPPHLIPNPINTREDVTEDYLYLMRSFTNTYEGDETENNFFLNWAIPIRISRRISVDLKTGTKYRLKDRNRLNRATEGRLDSWSTIENLFLPRYPDLERTTVGNVGFLKLTNFLDPNFSPPRDYLLGQYEYLYNNWSIDEKFMREIFSDITPSIQEERASGRERDYITHESIFANYLMATIKIGNYVQFIPGIRHERSHVRYTAASGAVPTSEVGDQVEYYFKDTTATNTYHHLLPQIHLKIEPFKGFDIRLAYTNTLSRPDYDQLAPKKLIKHGSKRVELGSVDLKPAHSRNYDLILTYYNQRVGLLSAGAFYKTIDGFLWTRNALILANTQTAPENFGLQPWTLGWNVIYPLNNENTSNIKGIEVDAQTNLDFLPAPFNRFILNMNFTLMDSKMNFNETLIKRVSNPDFGVVPGAPRIKSVNADTIYIDRMLHQPSYLANIALGYDQGGFSARLSFNYQDDILTKEQRRPDGADRQGTQSFSRWDFQISQKLTKKLSLYGNMANITNQPDRQVQLINNYYTKLEYYGFTALVGLKYSFR
jgi:TonB-dependent receptor